MSKSRITRIDSETVLSYNDVVENDTVENNHYTDDEITNQSNANGILKKQSIQTGSTYIATVSGTISSRKNPKLKIKKRGKMAKKKSNQSDYEAYADETTDE